MTETETKKRLRDYTVPEAVGRVEQLEAHLAELHQKLNALADRATEVKREIHEAKTELGAAISNGDPEALADDSPEAAVEALQREAARIAQAADRTKKQIRRTKIDRDTLIGLAVEHYDAELAAETEALAKDREKVMPGIREYVKRWNALAAKRRRLAFCHDTYRAKGSHIRGRRPSEVPERIVAAGDEPPKPSAFEGELPHLAEIKEPW